MEDEDARVSPTRPYKPRKLLQDPYHRMLRQAREHKPPNALKEQQHERTREKWERKNHVALEKRREFVRDQRKSRGLAATEQGTSMNTPSKLLFSTRDSVTALSGAPLTLRALQREIEEIEQTLMAIDALSAQHRRLITASTSLFKISDTPAPTTSPNAPATKSQKIDEKSLKLLREKSAAISSLHEVLDSLSTLSAQLTQGGLADSKDLAQHIAGLNALRTSAETKMNAEYDFLQSLATKSAPPTLAATSDKLATIVRNSLQYENVTAYVYAFEDQGMLCYARYLHLETLTSDDGTLVPDLYIVVTLRGIDQKMFMEINHDWVQPSALLFVREIDGQPRTLVRALSQLLAINHYNSSVGDLPLQLLVTTQQLRHKIRAPEAVSQVAVDDDTGALTFYLKPTITDVEEVKRIALQLHADVQNMTRRSGGQVRHTIQQDPDPKRAKSRRNWRVTFTATTGAGKLAVTPENLSFLSAQYGLNEQQVNQITRIINKARGG